MGTTMERATTDRNEPNMVREQFFFFKKNTFPILKDLDNGYRFLQYISLFIHLLIYFCMLMIQPWPCVWQPRELDHGQQLQLCNAFKMQTNLLLFRFAKKTLILAFLLLFFSFYFKENPRIKELYRTRRRN